MPLRILALSIVLLLASSLTRNAAAMDEPVFRSCEIGDPAGKQLVSAECTTIDVPENPQDPAGKKISLHIAKLSARSSDSKSDPFTLIAGGPGQSASESWPTVRGAFERIRKRRDIYLVDQRGTGLSNKLECPSIKDNTDPFVFNAEALAQLSSDCQLELDGDPRYYTTSVAVRDLDFVRESLGFEQWNIYGISYGTRVGLHYLRRFPESVRTLTLDAVVAPGVALGPAIALDAEAAFEKMLQRCANNTHCQQRYPALGSATRALIDRLRDQPEKISFENFNTGQIESMDFTLAHLTLTLRMLSYSSHGVAILPNMLSEAYSNNNFAPFARQAKMQVDSLGTALATGMYNAVVCTEDFPFLDENAIDREALAQTYLGTDAVDAIKAGCSNWPGGVIDDDFRQAVQSDKPVLILSGAADPVTPPHYADMIAATLPNSLHIINPGQGHMQAVLGCMPVVLANFITRGNTEDIDYGCLERLSPEPFFVDANGPMP